MAPTWNMFEGSARTPPSWVRLWAKLSASNSMLVSGLPRRVGSQPWFKSSNWPAAAFLSQSTSWSTIFSIPNRCISSVRSPSKMHGGTRLPRRCGLMCAKFDGKSVLRCGVGAFRGKFGGKTR